MPQERHPSISSVLAAHGYTEDAASLASIDREPTEGTVPSSPKSRVSLAPSTLALLAPASILGVLARLWLQSLLDFEGRSIFPLAYVQATGCLVLGFGLGYKEPIERLYVSTSNFEDLFRLILSQLWSLIYSTGHW